MNFTYGRSEATRWLKDHIPSSRRRQVVAARLKARSATSSIRVLPDFLIIGAQRCGTSSLYKHLGAHRQIVPSIRKEVEYFSTRFGEGESWYRSHFPLGARVRGRDMLTFEATPDYMLDIRASARAGALVPDAKIIAMLREPAERAYSQYQHNQRLGLEPLSFEDAIFAESDRTRGETEKLQADRDYRALPLRRHAYVRRGLYASQLRAWLEVFPADQLHVVRFEDMIEAPGETLRGIERFLGIADWIPASFTNHSYGRSGPGSMPPMTHATRTHLQQVFAAPNRELESLIGRSLGWSGEATSGLGS